MILKNHNSGDQGDWKVLYNVGLTHNTVDLLNNKNKKNIVNRKPSQKNKNQ